MTPPPPGSGGSGGGSTSTYLLRPAAATIRLVPALKTSWQWQLSTLPSAGNLLER